MKIMEVEMADKMEDVTVEQDQLYNIVCNGQRGRIEEQRCAMAPMAQRHVYSPDPDEFFQFLLKSQSKRLDDQRATHSSLPGMEVFTIRDPKDGAVLKTNFEQICNMVCRAQSFRKNATASLTPGASDSVRRSSFSPPPSADSDIYNTLPTRSASFNPISEKDRMDCETFQREQEQLLCVVSQAQRGRIEEQRCAINPFSNSPRQMDTSQTDQEVEKFFKLTANTENCQIDDQRARLNLISGIQVPPGMTLQDSDQLFNMVSRIQGARIDDQRCYAPKIQLGTPAPPRKSHSQPTSPNNPPSEPDSPNASSRRSAVFSPVSEMQNCIDQEKFFALVNQVQQRRMDDQRCAFEPYKKSSSSPNIPIIHPTVEDPEQFFKLVADFQSRRMDDQRVLLNSLPGIHPSSTGARRENNKTPAPQIVLTPASPAAPKKVSPSPSSPSLMVGEPYTPLRPAPRSASYCPVADTEGLLYEDMSAQISFQISMCFPPHQMHGANNQQRILPEVFLTIGQGGEAVVLPLSPRYGRPVSLNVNAPRNHRSRSSSPHRSPGRQVRSRPSSPNPADTAGPIGPYEDYITLNQRVHGSQMQQSAGRDRAEPSKEAKKGKVKSSGKKEKKEGNKDKKK